MKPAQKDLGTSARPARSTGAHQLRARSLAPEWLILYAASFAVALFCGTLRAALADPILWIAAKLIGISTAPVHDLALLAGYGPLVLSLTTLVLPFGGWWWRQQAGGRSPSSRERTLVAAAIEALTQANPGLRQPRCWFVLDVPELHAAVYADTLMLTRGLLESGHLEAVLAHELAHLNSSDARLAAALHRLTTPPRREFGGLRTLSLLPTGGFAFWLTRTHWAAYWRAREHQADRYAAALGQAGALARYRETNDLAGDLPILFIPHTGTSHPSTEHSIDWLS